MYKNNWKDSGNGFIAQYIKVVINHYKSNKSKKNKIIKMSTYTLLI